MTEIFSLLEMLPASAQNLILSVLISLIVAFILWLFRARVVITWGLTSVNVHHFRVPESDLLKPMSTQKFFIHNAGRKPASSVEIVLSAEPTSYSLAPNRDHQRNTLPDGQYSIKVPTIAPKELLIVDLLDLDLRAPRLISVNCPEALAKQVNFLSQRQYPKTLTWLVAYLMSAGLIGTIYLALQLFFGE